MNIKDEKLKFEIVANGKIEEVELYLFEADRLRMEGKYVRCLS